MSRLTIALFSAVVLLSAYSIGATVIIGGQNDRMEFRDQLWQEAAAPIFANSPSGTNHVTPNRLAAELNPCVPNSYLARGAYNQDGCYNGKPQVPVSVTVRLMTEQHQ